MAGCKPCRNKEVSLDYNARIIQYIKENKILIRYVDKLLDSDIKLDCVLEKEYNLEKIRVNKLEGVIYKINKLLLPFKNKFMFFKNFQHYPDMGDDIDILILDDYDNIKSYLINSLDVHELSPTMINKIAGKSMLISNDKSYEIELHNKKLGRFGEFDMTNINFNTMTQDCRGLNLPKIELALVINIIQRIYTRSYLRLSEIMFYKEKIYKNKVRTNIVMEMINKLKIVPGYNLYIKLFNEMNAHAENNGYLDTVFNNKYLTLENNIIRISYYHTIPLILKRLMY